MKIDKKLIMFDTDHMAYCYKYTNYTATVV